MTFRRGLDNFSSRSVMEAFNAWAETVRGNVYACSYPSGVGFGRAKRLRRSEHAAFIALSDTPLYE